MSIKNALCKAKVKASVAAMAASAAVFGSALPVLAGETGSSSSGTANNAVVDALTTTANDMVATGTQILPVALIVVGLALVVTFGIKIFKKVSGK